MKTIRFATLLLAASALLGGCNDKPQPQQPEIPTPNPPEEGIEDNTYVLGDTATPVGSAFGIGERGLIYVVISPDEGISSFKDMTDKTQYLQFAIDPDLEGRDVDVETETEPYGVFGEIGGYSLTALADAKEDLAGTFCVKLTDDGFTLSAKLTIKADGKKLECKASGKYTPAVVSDNFYTVNDETFPIRAGFYIEEETCTRLFLTTSQVEEGTKLDDQAYHVVRIAVDNSLLGKRVDVATAEGFTFEFFSNLNAYNTIAIGTGKPDKGTGWFRVEKGSQPETYTVEYDVTMGGAQYTGCFSGKMTDYYYEIPLPNEYTVNKKDTRAINSTVMTLADGLCTVWVSPAENLATVEAIEASEGVVRMTIAESFADGSVCGFSNLDNMTSITFEGKTRTGADGNLGNVSLRFDGDDNILVKFNLYDSDLPMRGYFKGKAVIITQ